MALKTCTVSCFDLKEVKHTVEVSAGSVYEAVAALRIFRDNEWVEDIGRGQTPISVKVKSRRYAVEYTPASRSDHPHRGRERIAAHRFENQIIGTELRRRRQVFTDHNLMGARGACVFPFCTLWSRRRCWAIPFKLPARVIKQNVRTVHLNDL